MSIRASGSTNPVPVRKGSATLQSSGSAKLSTSGSGKSAAPTPVGATEYGLHRSFAEVSAKFEAALAKNKEKGKEDKGNFEGIKKDLQITEHIPDIKEVISKLESDMENGLTSDEAAKRLARDGRNELTPPPAIPWWKKVLKHFFTGFSILLWVAAALSFTAYGIEPLLAQDNLYIGIVLIIVVVGAGGFSFYQEEKSASVMKGFSNLIPTMAVVTRDGNKTSVEVAKLVVGDIVDIKIGDKVPADIRIFQCASLKVDNSTLTGESEPQSRGTDMTNENPMETKNLGFFSTPVAEGTGRGVVIRTGDHTVIGNIANLASAQKEKTTPISLEIIRLVKIIAGIAVATGVVFLIIGVSRLGTSADAFLKSFIYAVGIIVASVPEGLLPTVTVALTLTARRMAARNVLVKNLEAVETLGSTSCICSDKTGTLTQNRMTASHLWIDGEMNVCSPVDTKADTKGEAFLKLIQVGALCNTAEFDPTDMDTPVLQRRCVGGNATEYAILKYTHQIRDTYEHRGAFQQCAIIPFNSTNKWAFAINRNEEGKEGYIFSMKGAPERVLDRCKYILIKGKKIKLDKKWKARFTEAYESLGSLGERVIGFATNSIDSKKFPKDFKFDTDKPNFPTDGMTFVGLISLIDPPREAVPAAVKDCHTASVKVIMVTGDHPLTAKAIAKQVGIIRDPTVDEIAKRDGIPEKDVDKKSVHAIVVTGADLLTMSEAELDAVLEHEQIVFARTSPQQKIRVVTGCQRQGHIVAVTGDGVNDSPALKKANIGIAMNSGSDVSKDSADMVLLDDNFASIIHGIEQGRTIFDNLKKSIAYKLTANFPEIVPFILFVVGQLPLMLPIVLILCIDVGTDMWPAIALAYEKPEADIMQRKPRDLKKDRLINAKLLGFAYLLMGLTQAVAGFFTFSIIMMDAGYPAPRDIGFDGLGNGFPLSSLFGLSPQFLPQLKVTDYAVCRVGLNPRTHIGCEKNVTTLNDMTPNFSGNATQDILARKYVDYCYDDSHSAVIPTCQLGMSLTRKDLLYKGHAGYFATIIICQWACLFMCKTRYSSLFQQGIHNLPLVLGWIFENVMAAVIIWVPYLNTALETSSLSHWQWVLLPVPFALAMFVFDEIRKYLIRAHPHGWVHDHTYY